MCVFLFSYVSYTGSLLVDFGSGKCVCVCVFLFLYVSYTGSLLVDFGSVKCVCVFVLVCQLHWLFASRLRQREVCVCVFVFPVCQLHWLFASRLWQWEVCVCLFFSYVSYTGSLLVDFGMCY